MHSTPDFLHDLPLDQVRPRVVRTAARLLVLTALLIGVVLCWHYDLIRFHY